MIQQHSIRLNILRLTIAIQLTILGFIGLNILNINTYITAMIQELVILVYLLLIPGLLILKILRVKACVTITLLFSIGISVALITFLSTFASIALAPFYDKPLSKMPLTLLLLLFSTLLLILVWRKANDYTITINFSRLHVLLLYLPILMIIGKASQNHFLMFAVLMTVSLLPLIILIYKLNEKFYPLIIWSISLSLVFNRLIFESRFNIRYDDTTPCVGIGVIEAGIWDPTYPVTHNSLLIPTIFPTIFSILSGIDIAIGTRIILCIITSLIPVVTYQIFKQFFNCKISFLASCLHAFYPFYPWLVCSGRTCFAFFFLSLLVLLILLTTNKATNYKINELAFNILLLIFVFSIVTSHYGTTYMFMAILIVLLVFVRFERIRDSKFNYNMVKMVKPAVLIFLFAFSWYSYTSNATNFGWGVSMYHHLLTSLEDLFNPNESAAVRAFVTRSVTPSFSLEATKWLLFIIFIFIIIGAIKMFYLYIKNKVDITYAILTLSFCSALTGITQMGMPRIFQFSMLLTAPLAIWGFSEILKLVRIKEERKHLLAFSVYLFILFAFTYGFVANSINFIAGEVKDMSLHGNIKEKILESDNIHFKRFVYWGWQPDPTYKAVAWFFVYKDDNKIVFVDFLIYDSHLFTLHIPRKYGGKTICNLIQPKLGSLYDVCILKNKVKDGYVFLAYHNLHDNFIYVVRNKTCEIYLETSRYHLIFEKMNKIYENDGGIFYLVKY